MLNNNRTPKDLRLRQGRVFIHGSIIDDNPADVLEILAHFVVVRADADFMLNGVFYLGYSHLFEVKEAGSEVPQYDIILTRNWRGQVTTLRASKRKEQGIYEFQS